MYIPTALSPREGAALKHYAKGKRVVEAGALLGYSTIQLASSAAQVVSIDHHRGYYYWLNDTYRQFKRNLEVAGVSGRVRSIIGDYRKLTEHPAEFAFIDLDGTYLTTLNAIRMTRAPVVAVHDFERTSCRGVAAAIESSGCLVTERLDSLIILKKTPQLGAGVARC